MRKGGKKLSQTLQKLAAKVQPGVTGRQLADIAQEEIKKAGLRPILKGYEGFPDVMCVSINDAIVHGMPGKKPIKEGDVVNLDLTVSYKNLILDSAISVYAGKTPPADVKRLLEGTKRALEAGVDAIKGDGSRVGDISTAIQNTLDSYKLGVIRDLVGHAVGDKIHEEPSIPLDRIIISLRKGKPRKIEDVISEMELKSYLKELANSKNLDKKEKIQESYRIELKQNSCTYSEVGTLDYSVIQTQKLYEESGIPFEERTVKLAYSILLEKENTRLGYINTLDFLLWLKETTGIKPKEKLIKKALSSLISISFNHRNPKSYFEKLEKLGETRITDLLNESETNQLKRVYFYAVKYFESEKMRGLESVTGIKPNLTEEAYQRIYLRSFEHEGVAEMYKIYKHYLVPPSEEFFARFVERYANITMENKFERKFISDVL